MGKRGKGRLDTKEGNIFKSSRSSGFVRSGDVHIRMYCSSVSSKESSALEAKGVCSPCIGLRGSSCTSEPSAPRMAGVFFGDSECDSTGVSRNGSLGARARFG